MPIIRSARLYMCYYRLWCAMSWLLVVGGQVQDSRLCVRDEGCCSHNTHIVSISRWWAQKCPKHVEHIISAIKHSVASGWFFFSTHMQRCTDKHPSSLHNTYSADLLNFYEFYHCKYLDLLAQTSKFFKTLCHNFKNLFLRWHLDKNII